MLPFAFLAASLRASSSSAISLRPNFSKAAADLRRFLTAEDNNAVAWNLSGLCEAQLGNLKAAFRAYERATALDAAFKEAWLNLAQLHRESGAGKVALRHFERALAATGGKYPQALQMRGLCHHGMGRTALALADFQGVLRLEPNHAEALCMAGVCCQSLGRLRRGAARLQTGRCRNLRSCAYVLLGARRRRRNRAASTPRSAFLCSQYPSPCPPKKLLFASAG